MLLSCFGQAVYIKNPAAVIGFVEAVDISGIALSDGILRALVLWMER